MAKFRKRPVVIEAEQWFPGRQVPGVCFCHMSLAAPAAHVHTRKGTLYLLAGDWVVVTAQKECYRVKPDIFAATYEPVEEATNDGTD